MLRNVIKWRSYKGTCIYQTKLFLTNSVVESKKISSIDSLKLNSSQRKLLEFYIHNELPNKDLEKQLKELKSKIIEKKELIKSFKNDNAEETKIIKEVKALMLDKDTFAMKIHNFLKSFEEFDSKEFNKILKKHFFYDKAFSLYGGASGLFDLGPIGCAIQNNLVSEWRKFFILSDQMHEIDCTILTPEIVLKASGHSEKFADIMVKDKITREAFRVDHLLKAELEKMIKKNKSKDNSQLKEIKETLKKVENSQINDLEEIDKIIAKFNIKSPSTGNELTSATQFNLMFQTQFGSSSDKKSFLRPETAQGIISNFERLISFNQNKLPLAVAQVGKSFRNEINPKNGLIRQREFLMAEIEYFLDPNNKSHPKFAEVEHVEVCLYSAKNQENDESPQFIKIGDAVQNKLINNQALGYFIGKVHQFLLNCGVDKSKLRFRQHMQNEMAHYACDCWDAECFTSYGWIECVGCADRSSYDLIQHSKHSGQKLVVDKPLAMPKSINVVEIQLNKENLSKEVLKEAKFINEYLKNLSREEVENYEKQITNLGENKEIVLGIGEREFDMKASFFNLKRYEKKVYVEEIIPAIIEPSFGIGRIMYAILEHSFKKRPSKKEDDISDRYLFSLPPKIAPYKCVILPLGSNDVLKPFIETLSNLLANAGISHKIDDNRISIGRRYIRNDELAIPFAITVDFDTLTEPNSVTLRNRDSRKQIRINISDLTNVLNELIDSKVSWNELESKFPMWKHEPPTVDD